MSARQRPRDDKDRPARPIAALYLERPARVQIVDERHAIQWESARTPRRVLVPDDLLEQFVGLRNHPDLPAGIQRFADAFGALQLCREHPKNPLPYSHSPFPFPKPAAAQTIYGCSPAGIEGVPRWLEFIDQFRAAMSVATNLRAGRDRHIATVDWAGAFAAPISIEMPSARNDNADREALARLIRAMLFVGDVRPRVVWAANEPSPDLELGGGLFGALALQLLQWTTANRGIYQCQGCGRTYGPRRRARPGEATFCDRDDCQRKRKAMNARNRRAGK